MSKRGLVVSAFTVAIILTVVGWQQVMIYKTPPLTKAAVCFPSLFLVRFDDELFRVSLTLIQFPLLAGMFTLGIRRWRPSIVAPTVILVYALCVVAAFAIMRAP